MTLLTVWIVAGIVGGIYFLYWEARKSRKITVGDLFVAALAVAGGILSGVFAALHFIFDVSWDWQVWRKKS